MQSRAMGLITRRWVVCPACRPRPPRSLRPPVLLIAAYCLFVLKTVPPTLYQFELVAVECTGAAYFFVVRCVAAFCLQLTISGRV